jgi:hypothetical protein
MDSKRPKRPISRKLTAHAITCLSTGINSLNSCATHNQTLQNAVFSTTSELHAAEFQQIQEHAPGLQFLASQQPAWHELLNWTPLQHTGAYRAGAEHSGTAGAGGGRLAGVGHWVRRSRLARHAGFAGLAGAGLGEAAPGWVRAVTPVCPGAAIRDDGGVLLGAHQAPCQQQAADREGAGFRGQIRAAGCRRGSAHVHEEQRPCARQPVVSFGGHSKQFGNLPSCLTFQRTVDSTCGDPYWLVACERVVAMGMARQRVRHKWNAGHAACGPPTCR